MGFLSSIFGSGPSVVTQPQQSKYTPEQQALLNNLISYYSRYINQALPSYAGQRVAAAPQMLTGGTGAEYGSLMQALLPIATGEITQNPYMMAAYEENVGKPLIRNWQEDILPNLRGGSNKKGLLYGSSRENLETKRSGELATALAQGRTGVLSNMYSTGLQAQLNAIPQIMSVAEASRGLEQSRLDTAYQDWLRTQPGSRPQDQMMIALLGQGGMYPSDTVVTPGQEGLLQNIFKGWAASGFKMPSFG